ncbi:LysR family transcriptional regulator [Pseudosulfitobacter pseudonitzschiae]|nr:LysR family transcriptional regulator [Pseudosulfitobacter pseudonitzschiae]MBM1815997.1 LysR family transcriptional regulator [Pseudosulfitobacter pseudonitzschiae]MBM1833303.1 LysR family transcriptional regulator [Pseudosulfitobacter pseudonitzschiae]MBM1838170.1 LysR family transcriptional regulator [Pseudosulfitobacter pseudonitzschiae]MBM1842702.1 LysR family transcriptional regulator [Pseudosulfitobacter pseudonitzschiae]MBM1847568.1 LysR family transcriptional regulator [Pseudosulfi
MRELNRLQEMEVFLTVVDEGSFSAAALARRMTPSAVSKMMTRLEQRLGVTLMRRTTRHIHITDEGHAFARSARAILAALDQAEREVGCGPVAGIVRIATSSAYANHIFAPILPDLLRQHPDLEIELVIGDGLVDMGGQPIDLAVRAGPLPDSAMMTRSLGVSDIITVRAPDGLPGNLGFAYARRDPIWKEGANRVRATDGNTLAALARHGSGTVRVGRFIVKEELARGQLRIVAESPVVREEFHVVYLGKSVALPARVSTVVEYLVQKGRVDQKHGPETA